MVPGIRRSPLRNSPRVSLLQRNASTDSNESKARKHERLAALEEREPLYRQEILRLQTEVKLLANRAEEMEAERDNAHYNTEIWQSRVKEQQETLQVRDRAIAKLVHQDLKGKLPHQDDVSVEKLKEQHKEEFDRTVRWHESMLNTKNKRIDELERQVSQFKSQDSLIEEVHRLRGALFSKEREFAQVNQRVKELERECREAKRHLNEDAAAWQSKRRSMLLENEAQSSQLRELKRELWRAKDSSGEVHDLKQDLANARRQIQTLEAERRNVMGTARQQVEENVRSELQAAQQTHRFLEERLRTMEVMQKNITAPSKSGTASSGQEEVINQLKTSVQHLTNQLDSKRNMLRICQTKAEALEYELKGNSTESTDTESDCPSLDGFEKSESSNTKKVRFCSNELQDFRCALSNAEKDMKTIDEIASNQLNSLVDTLESNKAASDEAQTKIRQLESELKEARTKESQLEQKAVERVLDQALLKQAQKAREASEQSIVRTFERRISDVSSEKDATIDDLSNDLAAVRMKRDEDVTHLSCAISSLRAELDSIHKDYDEQLKHKDQHIYALEHTLHAQEQTMDNMRSEMDQLQSGMQDAATSRRGEVEGLEKEVMTLRGQLSKQEKQVTTLRMQLKEEQLGHKAERLRLEELVSEFESQVPKVMAKTSIENDQRMQMVKERLDQLKLRNHELKEENKQLGERLEKGIIKIKELESKHVEVADTKIECEILRGQVVELQNVLDETTHVTEISSLPEVEMPDNSTEKDKTFMLDRTSLRKSRPPPRSRKSSTHSIARLFKRRGQTSTASSAILVPDEEQAKPPQDTLSTGRVGRTMNF